MAICSINIFFDILYVWCGTSERKPPDLSHMSVYNELWRCIVEVRLEYLYDTIRKIVVYVQWFVGWDWFMASLVFFWVICSRIMMVNCIQESQTRMRK